MTKKPDEPLRGDAAYQAAKAEMAKRNDAARARGSKLRAEEEAAKLEARHAADARELENLPKQPGG